MPKITEIEFKATYELGKQVYEGRIVEDTATDSLVNEYGMSLASAQISVRLLIHFLEPKKYTRTLKPSHVQYYANRIFEDYGPETLKVFLKGLEYHIQYLEDSGMPNNRHRVLHNELSEKIQVEPIYGAIYSDAELDLKQEESLEDEDDEESGIARKTIEKGYKLAKEVYDSKGKTSQDDAIATLVDEESMNPFSARHLIESFQKLIIDEVYKMGFSKKHAKIYLENALNDYSKEHFIVFLNGLEKNITHIHKDGRVYKPVCALHNEYSAKVGKEQIYDLSTLSAKVKDEKLSEIEIMEAFNNENKDKIAEIKSKAEIGIPKGKYSGKYIVRVLENNPRKPKTWGHRGYALLKYLEPISYEDYMKLGARNNDIKWDLDPKRGYTEIFDSKEEAFSHCGIVEIGSYEKISGSKGGATPYTIDNITGSGCFIEEEKIERILKLLGKEKNLILQGPPGTGKTWLAKKLSYAFMEKKDNEQLITVQFHPNMSYEDFIMGYRPSGEGLKLSPGTFLKFIDKAKHEPDEKFVIVIEEINRGNPVQIFGEMLTLLEADKRKESEALWLCYQQEEESTNLNSLDCYVYGKNERVYIPENVYVIGTMNLTDKSLGVLDFAFRRRFAFIDLKPEFDTLWEEYMIEKMGVDEILVERIKNNVQYLNNKIEADPELGKQFCVGHSYFTLNEKVDDEVEWFENVVDTKIRPLLEEYWLDAPFIAGESSNSGKEKTKTKVEEAIEQLLSEKTTNE